MFPDTDRVVLSPPVPSVNPILAAVRDTFSELFEHQYSDVVVYGDREGETLLHEGPIRMRADG